MFDYNIQKQTDGSFIADIIPLRMVGAEGETEHDAIRNLFVYTAELIRDGHLKPEAADSVQGVFGRGHDAVTVRPSEASTSAFVTQT